MPRLIFASLFALLVASCGSAEGSEPSPSTAGAPLTSLPTPGIDEIESTTAASSPADSPTTDPASTTASTTTDPAPSRLVVSATGDVNLDPSYITELATEGYRYPWTGLQGMFESDDLTIVNLECPVSNLGTPLEKEFVFRCAIDALPSMRAAGVEVANLGNNHAGDYGLEAMADSRTQLEAAEIAPVGVGIDDAEAHQPALFDINGWTVAVLGFGGVVPTPDWIAGPNHPGMADGDTTETIVAAVAAADEIADIVLVTIHWGVELDTSPQPDDRERAEAMIAAGADAIFGHHAHRLQPLEWVDGAPVAWGLGNFVWPNFSEPGSTTAVAQVVFEPDGSVEACLLPAYIDTPGRPVLRVDYDPDDPCGPVR